LLEGFLCDSKKCLNNISDYAFYTHSLQLEFGNEIDKMKSCYLFYGFRINDSGDNIKKSINNGKTLFNSFSHNTVKTGISLKIWWDYYQNEKKEFEKVCLLGFLSFKSMMLKSKYRHTTNIQWLSRMDGKPKTCNPFELSEEIKKYHNEYQTKKIKLALSYIDKDSRGWGLKTYSINMRGFAISFSLSIEKLAELAESRKLCNKKIRLKNNTKEAQLKARSKLGIIPINY
jgi:hypothetical protein